MQLRRARQGYPMRVVLAARGVAGSGLSSPEVRLGVFTGRMPHQDWDPRAHRLGPTVRRGALGAPTEALKVDTGGPAITWAVRVAEAATMADEGSRRRPSRTDKSEPRCPRCGSTEQARVLWGMPVMDPELEGQLERGEVVLGGCLVGPGSSKWHCRACGFEWHDASMDAPPVEIRPYVGRRRAGRHDSRTGT